MALRPIPGAPPGAAIPDFPRSGGGHDRRSYPRKPSAPKPLPVPEVVEPEIVEPEIVEPAPAPTREAVNGWADLRGIMCLFYHNGQLKFMVTPKLGKRGTMCHVPTDRMTAMVFASNLAVGRPATVSHTHHPTLYKSSIEHTRVGSSRVFVARVNTLKATMDAPDYEVIEFASKMLSLLKGIP